MKIITPPMTQIGGIPMPVPAAIMPNPNIVSDTTSASFDPKLGDTNVQCLIRLIELEREVPFLITILPPYLYYSIRPF